MTSLIGTAPQQVPTNADLGGMAYQDPKNVAIEGGNATLDKLDFTTDAAKSAARTALGLGSSATLDVPTLPNLRPKLAFDFLNTKRLDPRIAFSRSSTATYFDHLGVLRTALANRPRFDYDPITRACRGLLLETAATNSFTYTENFDDASWAKGATVSALFVMPNQVVAPDGNQTADKLIPAATATTGPVIYRTLSVTANRYRTFSCFLKAAGYTNAYLQVTNVAGTLGYRAEVNLQDGSVTAVAFGGAIVAEARAVPVGNGWYRVQTSGFLDNSLTSLNTSIYVLNNTKALAYSPDGLSGVYAWGAQFESGQTMSSYIANNPTFTSRASTATYFDNTGTLKTAAIDVARTDYDPITKVTRGLLLENAATNLAANSSDFQEAAWTKTGVTITPNATLAPDGTQTADKVVETTATAGRTVACSISATSQYYVFSVYVKAGERSKGQIRFQQDAVFLGRAIFDLTTGAITHISGAANPQMQAVGNGWYRIALAAIPSGASTLAAQLYMYKDANDSSSYTGDGVSGFYAWGAQLETGLVASSYIPTPQVFTSRASTAAYHDAAGYLQMAANNVARTDYDPSTLKSRGLLMEGAATSLVTLSNKFDTATWSKSNCSIVANMQPAPTGHRSMSKLIEDNTNTSHFMNLSGFTMAIGTQYTGSIYAKAGERSLLFIQGSNTTANGGGVAVFDLALGVVTQNTVVGSVATIAPIMNGIYRCSVTFPSTAVAAQTLRYGIYSPSTSSVTFQGDGLSGLYVWGAQCETGLVLSSYIPSVPTFTSRASIGTYTDSAGLVKTAAVDTVRNQYDPTNATIAPYMLLENASTNYLLQSADPSNASWTKSGVTVASSAVLSPDGTATAFAVSKTGSASQAIYQSVTGAGLAVGSTVTASCFFKAGTATKATIGVNDQGGSGILGRWIIDLTNGSTTVVTAGDRVVVIPYPNGWYRVCLTVTMSAAYTDARVTLFPSDYSDTTSTSVYMWGMQAEVAKAESSYIPTTTAAVTRAADVFSTAAGSRAADVYTNPTVTRAADINSIAATLTRSSDSAVVQNTLFDFNPDEGSVLVQHDYVGRRDTLAGTGYTARFDAVASLTAMSIRQGVVIGGTDFYVDDPSGNQVDSGTYALTDLDTPYRHAYAYKKDDFAYTRSGQTPYTDTQGVVPKVTQLTLFLTDFIHLQKLAYYNKRLTNAELQALTS